MYEQKRFEHLTKRVDETWKVYTDTKGRADRVASASGAGSSEHQDVLFGDLLQALEVAKSAMDELEEYLRENA